MSAMKEHLGSLLDSLDSFEVRTTAARHSPNGQDAVMSLRCRTCQTELHEAWTQGGYFTWIGLGNLVQTALHHSCDPMPPGLPDNETEHGPNPVTWFSQGVWPTCICGYDPHDNRLLTAHWASHGFRVVDDHGHLIREEVSNWTCPGCGSTIEPSDVRRHASECDDYNGRYGY